MAHRALLFLLAPAFALVAGAAHADDEPTWDERSGWTTEIAFGEGVALYAADDGEGGKTRGAWGDTSIRVGFHRVGAYHGKGVLGLEASELAWCMPMMACGGPIGAFFGPTSAFLGNELGIDVAAHVLHGVSGEAPVLGAAVGVRPTFRVARDSRFRTASFVGSLLPEVGLAFPDGLARKELYLELSLYPIAMTTGSELAVQWDVLRERVGIPLDGGRATIAIGTSLSVLLR